MIIGSYNSEVLNFDIKIEFKECLVHLYLINAGVFKGCLQCKLNCLWHQAFRDLRVSFLDSLEERAKLWCCCPASSVKVCS
jgi:hypothetical protein